MRLDDHRGSVAISEKQARYAAIVAMLVGLVACLEPIFYAYGKAELRQLGLI